MKVFTTKLFEEDYQALPGHIQTAARRKLALFVENPRHPSLQVKKMEDPRDIWEARITKSYRFTFHWKGDLVLLRRIGAHDILKRP